MISQFSIKSKYTIHNTCQNKSVQKLFNNFKIFNFHHDLKCCNYPHIKRGQLNERVLSQMVGKFANAIIISRNNALRLNNLNYSRIYEGRQTNNVRPLVKIEINLKGN